MWTERNLEPLLGGQLPNTSSCWEPKRGEPPGRDPLVHQEKGSQKVLNFLGCVADP